MKEKEKNSEKGKWGGGKERETGEDRNRLLSVTIPALIYFANPGGASESPWRQPLFHI